LNIKKQNNQTKKKISTYVTPSMFTKTVHNKRPDYKKPILELTSKQKNKLLSRLEFIYGKEKAKNIMPELERIMKVYYATKPSRMIKKEKNLISEERFNQEDIILITYGDLIKGEEKSPLATLAKFCDEFLKGTINTIHILPFFPYSSDRGFSVKDFTEVDPRLGTWEDIEKLENRYQLMFDGVFNHVSSKSKWFQEFLNGAPYYKEFFISFTSPDNLSLEHRKKIFRPRTSNILARYCTINGLRYVWSTFSRDQIDLKFENPDVLIKVLETLLLYVRKGSDIIRLDAVTYLWSEPGTSCINLEETHEIVKLIRDVLNIVAPWVALITETNVPHSENVSYFGNGRDEAQMVYNFALPPLVLYTFYSEDATILTEWAKTIKTPSNTTTFFNFLDTHDGIGLMGAKNILTDQQIKFLINRAKQHGGLISYRTTIDKGKEPYEINITWFSALNRENNKDEEMALQIKRFVASRAISLIIPGVPGIYLHSLIGTENDIKAVESTKLKRNINRSVISYKAIRNAIKDPSLKVSKINRRLGKLLSIRAKERAFHPNSSPKLLQLSCKVFSIIRTTPERDEHILALVSISSESIEVKAPLKKYNIKEWINLLNGDKYNKKNGDIKLLLKPYDIIFLKGKEKHNKNK